MVTLLFKHEVIPCVYDVVIMGFYKGLAKVESNGKWGVIDRDGNYIIQPIASSFSDISW